MVSLRSGTVPHSPFHESGRFGRIFPYLPVYENSDQFLTKLGKQGGLMDEGFEDDTAAESTTITAGFTFFGQFIDHDITFDTTSSLERQNDPTAIRNFRTPILELDSVYGMGPEASPYLYDKNNLGKLLIGNDKNPHDLPRNSQEIALIGDPRNDENLIISQLHLAFIKFHNRVVDEVKARGFLGEAVFPEAQRLVRWHYQWIVLNEYLPLIVGQAVVDDILNNGRKFFSWQKQPFIPVEFSVAAFRLGHTQVRNRFRVNDRPESEKQLFELRVSGAVPPAQVVDWKKFFQFDSCQPPQFSKKLDAKIASVLLDLPVPIVGEDDPRRSLAIRNLFRGKSFSLPSGQAVAKAMGIKPLSDEQLGLKELGYKEEVPLWFYILKEGEVQTGGETLGEVGGRLVAEVLIGLLEGDFMSYLKIDPCWVPCLPSTKPGEFKMADLLNLAAVC
ncbi:MAG: peroxidase [Symploca sp. SIO2B6]|nr:peroxidase [Symploca sp. SIO2B6]